MDSIDARRIDVYLPNLFISFLAQEPALNPHYNTTRLISETAVCEKCHLQGRVAKAVVACDFSYFGAAMVPRADATNLRTICEWGNWIFPFDDLFDDGPLRLDKSRAQETMDSLLSVFGSISNPAGQKTLRGVSNMSPLIRFHDTIWARIQDHASPEVQFRYARAMQDYCDGALEQVSHLSSSSNSFNSDFNLENTLAMRRKSVCVATLFTLVEFGHGLTLPSYVFEHPLLKRIEMCGIDITLLHNDLLSYRKEESEGVPHNVVVMARLSGLSAQQAVDRIASLIELRHRELDETMREFLKPRYGEAVDSQVCKYVQGIKDVVKANLYWSFKSDRFLSAAQKTEVLKTGRLDVLARPAFLKNRSSVEDGAI